MIENHRHTFAVADIGDFDLDEDRSIVPSIENILKSAGIEAVVDGEEYSQAVFTVHTRSPRSVIEEALEGDGIYLEK